MYHNYVNELARNLIIHSAEVFPIELDGPIYDKFAIDVEPEHIGYMDDKLVSSLFSTKHVIVHCVNSPLLPSNDPFFSKSSKTWKIQESENDIFLLESFLALAPVHNEYH